MSFWLLFFGIYHTWGQQKVAGEDCCDSQLPPNRLVGRQNPDFSFPPALWRVVCYAHLLRWPSHYKYRCTSEMELPLGTGYSGACGLGRCSFTAEDLYLCTKEQMPPGSLICDCSLFPGPPNSFIWIDRPVVKMTPHYRNKWISSPVLACQADRVSYQTDPLDFRFVGTVCFFCSWGCCSVVFIQVALMSPFIKDSWDWTWLFLLF